MKLRRASELEFHGNYFFISTSYVTPKIAGPVGFDQIEDLSRSVAVIGVFHTVRYIEHVATKYQTK